MFLFLTCNFKKNHRVVGFEVPISSALVDWTVPICQTDVLGVLLDGPFEETLTTFAGPDTVVLAGRVVAANST